VGDPCSEFVRTAVRLAHEYEVDTVRCDDVYSAVAVTVKAGGRPVLVVGSLRDLARENGRFFQIAAACATRCCCYLEKTTAADHSGILPALRAGAAVLGTTREIRGVLEAWLTGGRREAQGPLGDLLADDLRTTEAELRALLGQGTDA
jgi:hypothetical protein